MPIGKKSMNENMPNGMMADNGQDDNNYGRPAPATKPKTNDTFGKQILWTLVGVLLVYGIFYVGVLTRNSIKNFDYIGVSEQMSRTITITGFGKVSSGNDIAVTSLGFSNVDSDVGRAQEANKKVMDPMLAELKKMGISDKDLQSNYTIYPEYNYTEDRGQEFKGYRVSSDITVKIRDLSKISAVLGLPGKFGATQVGGLSFTIDDRENLKDEARAKALADARQKAAELSRSLGVRLVAVVSYNEYEAGGPVPYPVMMREGGLGGGADMAMAPTVATGSQEVTMNVSITYTILP